MFEYVIPSDGQPGVSLKTAVRWAESGFPLGLENLEKWEGIFQSGSFEQTGKSRKITQNTGKNETISDKYYLIFLVIFKLTVYYLLKKINFSV